MDNLKLLQDTLSQKEENVLTYLRHMRELEDSENSELANLYADLAKAEEKHITQLKSHLTHSIKD